MYEKPTESPTHRNNTVTLEPPTSTSTSPSRPLPSTPTTPDYPGNEPTDPDIRVPLGSCIPSGLWRHHGDVASINVQLSPDADVLRFDKLGSLSDGTILFSTLPTGMGKTIAVEVIASHEDLSMLRSATMCVRRGEIDGVHGVTLLVRINLSLCKVVFNDSKRISRPIERRMSFMRLLSSMK